MLNLSLEERRRLKNDCVNCNALNPLFFHCFSIVMNVRKLKVANLVRFDFAKMLNFMTIATSCLLFSALRWRLNLGANMVQKSARLNFNARRKMLKNFLKKFLTPSTSFLNKKKSAPRIKKANLLKN